MDREHENQHSACKSVKIDEILGYNIECRKETFPNSDVHYLSNDKGKVMHKCEASTSIHSPCRLPAILSTIIAVHPLHGFVL